MDYTVSFFDAETTFRSEELCAAWREAISRSTNLRVALQTPEWTKFRCQFAGKGLIGIVRDTSGQIVGVAPLIEANFPLAISSGRSSLKINVKGVSPLGSEFLLSPEAKMYECIFSALQRLPHVQALYISGFHLNSNLKQHANAITSKNQPYWFMYNTKVKTNYYTIKLGNSFEEYSRSLSKKARYSLKQGLSSSSGVAGDVELVRYEAVEEAKTLLQNAEKIAVESWQKRLLGRPLDEKLSRVEVLEDMAKVGMLRSYVLKYGGSPCAFIVGFQCNGVYNFYETAYAASFEKLSPGKTLLYLVLLDLFEHNKPKVFYFGSGDEEYKRRFATDEGEEADIYLMRNTPGNRLRVFMHREFHAMKDFAKTSIKRVRGLPLR